MDYFRDIPSNLDPTFASALVFCKHTSSKKDIKDEYAAILLSLVRKGYIELERIKKSVEKQENINESLEMQVDELASLSSIQDVAQNYGLSYNNDNIIVIK